MLTLLACIILQNFVSKYFLLWKLRTVHTLYIWKQKWSHVVSLWEWLSVRRLNYNWRQICFNLFILTSFISLEYSRSSNRQSNVFASWASDQSHWAAFPHIWKRSRMHVTLRSSFKQLNTDVFTRAPFSHAKYLADAVVCECVVQLMCHGVL